MPTGTGGNLHTDVNGPKTTAGELHLQLILETKLELWPEENPPICVG